jgi:porin
VRIAELKVRTRHYDVREQLTSWFLLASLAAPCVAQEPVDGQALNLSARYTGDLRRNTSGGMAVGGAYSDAFDLGLAWTSDRLVSGARVSGNVAVMHLGGDGISAEYVGDYQGINNIESPAGWYLYESWVQLSFGDEATSLRAGVLDLNAEFDTPVTQGLFVGSPFGIGTEFSQTGVRGPVVWPTTGLGIRADGAIGEGLHWRLGVYDGAPGAENDTFTGTRVSKSEGALLIGELEYSSARIHKFALASWAYTAPFERIDAALRPPAGAEHGNYGFYGTFDMALGSAGPVSFDGALRAGTAPAEFNVIDRYAGAAVTATHFWNARPDDALGLGIAWARAGDPYRLVSEADGIATASAETLVELVYRAEVAPWLSLVPNLQYISNPSAMRDLDDAWVVGLRFELATDHSWQLSARRDVAPDGPYVRR